MEVNRIKWDEAMNDRCLERLRYSSPRDAGASRKRVHASEVPQDGRSAGVAQESIRAIGVGESMECKWISDWV